MILHWLWEGLYICSARVYTAVPQPTLMRVM